MRICVSVNPPGHVVITLEQSQNACMFLDLQKRIHLSALTLDTVALYINCRALLREICLHQHTCLILPGLYVCVLQLECNSLTSRQTCLGTNPLSSSAV